MTANSGAGTRTPLLTFRVTTGCNLAKALSTAAIDASADHTGSTEYRKDVVVEVIQTLTPRRLGTKQLGKTSNSRAFFVRSLCTIPHLYKLHLKHLAYSVTQPAIHL